VCTGDACYRVINPAGAAGDVAGCQETCDHMRFFDCLTAEELSMCRSACGTASADSIETFESCARGSCHGPECFEVFLEANW
jgi:hypothetical protein